MICDDLCRFVVPLNNTANIFCLTTNALRFTNLHEFGRKRGMVKEFFLASTLYVQRWFLVKAFFDFFYGWQVATIIYG